MQNTQLEDFKRQFNKDYEMHLEFAEACIRRYTKKTVSTSAAAEAVSIAYILADREGCEYSRKKVKGKVANAVFKLMSDAMYADKPLNSIPNQPSERIDLDSKKKCAMCKDEFPLSLFQYDKVRDRFLSYCPDCRKIMANRINKGRTKNAAATLRDWYVIDNLLKLKQYKGFPKSYFQSRPELVEEKRQQMLLYRARQASRGLKPLTDSYIIGVICKHGRFTPEYVRAHPEMISERRNNLLKKRGQLPAVLNAKVPFPNFQNKNSFAKQS